VQHDGSPLPPLTPTPKDKRRWKLASKFLLDTEGYTNEWGYRGRVLKLDEVYTGVFGSDEPGEPDGPWSHWMLRSRLRNRPVIFNLQAIFDPFGFDKNSLGLYAGLIPASLVYSGIHLLAWNTPIPSLPGVWLWRISAIIVGSYAPLDLLGSMLKRGITTLHFWMEFGSTGGRSYLPLGRRFFAGVFLLLYVAARVILIIESLIALPYSPDPVFQQPLWSRYFPHVN